MVPATVTEPEAPASRVRVPPLLVRVAPWATVTLVAEARVVLAPVVLTLPATVTDPLLLVLPTVRLPMPELASFSSVAASMLSVGAGAGAGAGAAAGAAAGA